MARHVQAKSICGPDPNVRTAATRNLREIDTPKPDLKLKAAGAVLPDYLANLFHTNYPVKRKRETWSLWQLRTSTSFIQRARPLAGFLRVGHTGHHKLEALHAADRLGFSRLVFDAAYAVGQADFLRAQKAAGREIVIDLNVAETAMSGRFGSAVGKLPWAKSGPALDTWRLRRGP